MKTISKQGINSQLSDLLRRLNGVLRGWTNYFRHGVSKATFGYVHQFAWLRVTRWLRTNLDCSCGGLKAGRRGSPVGERAHRG